MPAHHVGRELGFLLVVLAAEFFKQGRGQLLMIQLSGIDPFGPQVQAELGKKAVSQPLQVPFIGMNIFGAVGFDKLFCHILGDPQDVFFLILALQHLAAQAVDGGALPVHDIVVFQQMLAGLKVLPLHGLLRRRDPLGNQPGFNRHSFFHPQLLHDSADPLARKDAQQVVLQGQIESGATGVSFPAGAPSQLVVNPPRFMPLRPDDMQAAQRHHLRVFFLHGRLIAHSGLLPLLRRGAFRSNALLAQVVSGKELHVAAEQNIGAAPGHISGNGHGSLPSGLGHDFRFLGVILGVQHHMLDSGFLQQAAEAF